MRRRAGRIIFEIVMPNDGAWMLRDHPRTAHPRITIGVEEIDFPANENVLMIRAPSRENQRGQKRDFKNQSGQAQQSAIGESELKNGPTRIRTWDQGIMSPLL